MSLRAAGEAISYSTGHTNRCAYAVQLEIASSGPSPSSQRHIHIMIMKKSMFLFYFSITLAICSSALYHFTAKSTPSNVNYTVSLLVTYAVAFAVVLLTFVFFPIKSGLMSELKQLNWASIGLAIAVVGIEFGFLLTYRSGWNLGIAAVLVNVVASLILVPVAIFIFKDKISWINILGILVCLAGLVMLNWKR
jgi:drug/metabolite transporter (DMT)-like permease